MERRKAEAIAQLTQDAIISQVLQIKSRMPHKNIPQKYLDDLHTLLYADDYDEDAIKEELGKLKLSNYAASVFPDDDRENRTHGRLHADSCQGGKKVAGSNTLKYVKVKELPKYKKGNLEKKGLELL